MNKKYWVIGALGGDIILEGHTTQDEAFERVAYLNDMYSVTLGSVIHGTVTSPPNGTTMAMKQYSKEKYLNEY